MEPRPRLACLTLLFGTALVAATRFLFPFVGPFLMGLIVASLIEPAVAWSERTLRLPRRLSAALLLGLGVLLAGLLLCTVFLQIFRGLRAIALGGLGRDLATSWARFLEAGAGWLRGLPSPVRQAAAATLRLLPDRLAYSLRGLLAALGRVPEWMGFSFLGLVAAYFISRDRSLLGRFLPAFIPREWRGKALAVGDELVRDLTGLLRAQFSLVGLTFLLSGVGLWVLGIGEPWLVGALLGYLDLLPLVGPGAVILPWAGLRLAAGDWGRGVGLAMLFFLLAFVREGAEAKLIGRTLELHPLATLAAIYLGVRLFGAGGFVLGPLLLIFLRALHRALLSSGGLEEVFAGR